jgi:hypothetical protein
MPKRPTKPPRHEANELKIRLSVDEPEAHRIDGVWVSPGEEAWVPTADATRLVKEGKAELVA